MYASYNQKSKMNVPSLAARAGGSTLGLLIGTAAFVPSNEFD